MLARVISIGVHGSEHIHTHTHTPVQQHEAVGHLCGDADGRLLELPMHAQEHVVRVAIITCVCGWVGVSRRALCVTRACPCMRVHAA